MSIRKRSVGPIISKDLAHNVDAILKTIRSYLGMDVAFLAEFAGASRIFRNVSTGPDFFLLKAGDRLPLSTGYCQLVATGKLPELIRDSSALPLAAALPETSSVPIGSHLSVPVKLASGKVHGHFCCFSHRPRPDLSDRDLDLLRTFADLIAGELDVAMQLEETRNEAAERLRLALKRGDPRVVFQPIVRLADRKIVAVEALSRFDSQPVRPPDVWFAEAQSLELTKDLEFKAASIAIGQGLKLPDTISLNINLSPEALVSGEVQKLIQSFDPRRMVIEVTEHSAIEDYERILASLAPLREGGVRLAIDDVGAGYSSMRHALILQPDVLKFDMSLTRGIDADPRRQALVAALAEFARLTSTKFVAEGVETIEELNTLKALGVENAQGYYLGKPMALADVLKSLASGEAP